MLQRAYRDSDTYPGVRSRRAESDTVERVRCRLCSALLLRRGGGDYPPDIMVPRWAVLVRGNGLAHWIAEGRATCAIPFGAHCLGGTYAYAGL